MNNRKIECLIDKVPFLFHSSKYLIIRVTRASQLAKMVSWVRNSLQNVAPVDLRACPNNKTYDVPRGRNGEDVNTHLSCLKLL